MTSVILSLRAMIGEGLAPSQGWKWATVSRFGAHAPGTVRLHPLFLSLSFDPGLRRH